MGPRYDYETEKRKADEFLRELGSLGPAGGSIPVPDGLRRAIADAIIRSANAIHFAERAHLWHAKKALSEGLSALVRAQLLISEENDGPEGNTVINEGTSNRPQ